MVSKRNVRSKIDIANDRELKKRELQELVDKIVDGEVPAELQAEIDKVQAEIDALEEELVAIDEDSPTDPAARSIKVVGGALGAPEKRFSLLSAVRNVVENRSNDDFTQSIIDAGRSELSRAGIAARGQIVIPEKREAVQAGLAGKGLEAIATEKLDLIGPLYAELSLNKVGATFLTGLVSDLSIPVYSGTTAGWAGEIAAAGEGSGTFSQIVLKPKRLTAYMDISKQFILQDSTSAEALLRSDILETVRQKLEKTLLGAQPQSDTQPAGLFYLNPAIERQIVHDYGGVLKTELELLKENASPKFYLGSPLAYSNLRQFSKPYAAVTDVNANVTVGSSIVDNNTVSGIPLIISSNVYTDTITLEDDSTINVGGYLVGDFSNYVIAQWGNIDLTVDPYSRAIDGCVRLVVNAYFDAALKRPSVQAVLTTTDAINSVGKTAPSAPKKPTAPKV